MSENEKNKLLGMYRQQIDEIDEEIYKLLNRRAECALAIGSIKKELGTGQEFYVPQREAEILQHYSKKEESLIQPEALCAVYKKIIEACRNLQISHFC